MQTTKLKKFAQFARRNLIEQVTSKLSFVLAPDSPARREHSKAVAALEKKIAEEGREQVIERVAYTWFNRFCALRFMDVNRYNRVSVVSPLEGQFQPEILAEAKMGHIALDEMPQEQQQQVLALLDGKTPSRDAQGEAYRLLLVAACNAWHGAMPFLFQRIDDYTELLLPDDLLSGNSILAYVREALTPDACKDVEVIGWLYQFYISEKKDDIFEGLKKNQKITPENIPAATQLFTPDWIVRYLVENSLGRLWMLNRPGSKLVEQMDYYIQPEQPENDFLRLASPEEIKVCDPACGSGHMLVYAFDLLHAIYEEEGYEPSEIPAMILTHNLYGIEIDERAGEMAAFALAMKARARQRRFFERNRDVKPNICVLENVEFAEGELKSYLDGVGRDLFTLPLQETLHQFKEASNFGSLIRPAVTDVQEVLRRLEEKQVAGNMFLQDAHKKVLRVLRQVEYLSPKYHVVVGNPPYMGGKGMNGRLSAWLKDEYPDVKSDLFAAFIVRNTTLALPKGQLGFMSPFVWMFISSYEALRDFLINHKTITSLVQLEYSGFDGATVPICTFTVENAHRPEFKGGYVRLSDFRGSENQAPKTLEAIRNPECGWFYRASAADFKKIPGSPIAYWASELVREIFAKGELLENIAKPCQGLATADNNRFLRRWFETDVECIGFGFRNRQEAQISGKKWFPLNKGGSFRKWFGNDEFILNWENDGYELRNFGQAVIRNPDFYFKPGATWGKISSAELSVRFSPSGFIFSDAGMKIPTTHDSQAAAICLFLNSKVVKSLISCLSETLNFEQGLMARLPLDENVLVPELAWEAIQLSRTDWNSYETSWDFTHLPLLDPEYRQPTLEATYQKLRAHWQESTLEMQRLEEENNRLFIDAYGLQDELTPEVPLEEITLTCNPRYRYGGEKSEEELEALLLADTMRELVSYAVGCLFGRYALEVPGLVLANQGETLDDYRERVPEPRFMADKDNVIPILDGDWFADDIAARFRQFLRTAFGEQHYEENLRFVEQSLNLKGKRNYSIRDYFLGEFYNDHVRRYKKRPIYWLFSSPKGSFNALIYMHRYRPDTVSVVLNDYLREFLAKLGSHKAHLEAVSISESHSPAERTRALKEIDKVSKAIAEVEEYERSVLYPLATQQLAIDLDDGVKVNYTKFGGALKKIVGLEGKE